MTQAWFLSLVMFLAACQPEVVSRPTASDGSAVSLNQGQPGAAYRTLDDRFADLVDEIPGFAGLYYDETGTLTVNLTDPRVFESARPRLAEFLAGNVVAPPAVAQEVARAVAGARARPAARNFRELLQMYRAHIVPLAGTVSGITMTDIDDATGRFTVGVADVSRIGAVREAIGRSTLPPELVDVIHYPAVERSARRTRLGAAAALRHLAQSGQSLQARLTPPIPGGAKIAFQLFPTDSIDQCTLGYNLASEASADRYFVTNSHCLRPEGSVSGRQVGQATVSNPVGLEILDPPNFTSQESSNCPPGRACWLADAALVRYTNPSHAALGEVALPPLGSTVFSATIPIVYITTPFQGQLVRKVGQVTGHTAGQVTRVCVNVSVDPNFTYLCQSEANYVADKGDSGSPVIALIADGTAIAVGIHAIGNNVTGAKFFSELTAATQSFYTANPSLGLLDPRVPASPPGSLAPPTLNGFIDGPAEVGPGTFSCSWWAAVAQGGQSPFTYQWSGLFTGTEPSVTGTVPQQGGTLVVEVTDAAGAVGEWSLAISYNSANQDTCQQGGFWRQYIREGARDVTLRTPISHSANQNSCLEQGCGNSGS